MISQTAVATEPETAGSSIPDLALNRLGFMSRLLVSVWCGLVAGTLEVGTIALRKQMFDPDHISRISRHYVWMIPLSNLCVFMMLGLIGCGVVAAWPGRGRWLFARGMGATVILPSMLVAFPRIYALAWLIVALALAGWFVPFIDSRSHGFRRFVLVSFPVVVAVVTTMGGSLWAGDLLKQRRENERSLPAPGSPNVVLIVLDTVAAGHLSLHGYDRATSPTLVELAGRGVRFDAARAPSSWTLPSHATMFTGRWLHELSVGWVTPLDRAWPTLAEFIGDRGYATAGFVANTGYCTVDSGLARGFTRYQDFMFPELTPLKTAVLVSRAMDGVRTALYFLQDQLRSAGLLPYVDRLLRSLLAERKGAAVVNREFLDWLANRPLAERPFFAFLNFYDAHYPYELPPGRIHRFGGEATEKDQRYLIQEWGELDKTKVSPAGVAFAAAAYDDCIADLDEQLGMLIDQLNERGVLERTWLIITSDHGESFGEHPGNFCHGMSLYDTEVHVPLLIIPPVGREVRQVVKETVSLRDMAATIVDLAGAEAGSPFPGVSLARFWQGPGPPSPINLPQISPSLAEVVPDPRKQADEARLSPQAAVKDAEWSYIRREGVGREKLFHLSEDPKEQHDLAGLPSSQPKLEQMRAALDRLTGGPLSPGRFSR